jgi:hypothetical protein
VGEGREWGRVRRERVRVRVRRERRGERECVRCQIRL